MRPPLTRAEVTASAAALPTLADPETPDQLIGLLRGLYAIGRRDLPLGRLLEGHVDALQIVHRYGTPAQAVAASSAAGQGALFGVWNADRQSDPTRIEDDRLSGSKAFASGAGLVTHALISADVEGDRQLFLINLDAVPPAIDRSWWRVTGMQRSETHIVTWSAQPLGPDTRIGQPGDYVREPWFSGGAIRFAAVQAGGVAALVDRVREHLLATRRADDPFQRARLADLYRHAQAAADAARTAALGWSLEASGVTIARVAAARVAVYAAGEDALALDAAAVGVQAMFADHPLSVAMSDLDTYLRQPAPDAQRLLAGKAVADGLLGPAL